MSGSGLGSFPECQQIIRCRGWNRLARQARDWPICIAAGINDCQWKILVELKPTEQPTIVTWMALIIHNVFRTILTLHSHNSPQKRKPWQRSIIECYQKYNWFRTCRSLLLPTVKIFLLFFWKYKKGNKTSHNKFKFRCEVKTARRIGTHPSFAIGPVAYAELQHWF